MPTALVLGGMVVWVVRRGPEALKRDPARVRRATQALAGCTIAGAACLLWPLSLRPEVVVAGLGAIFLVWEAFFSNWHRGTPLRAE